MALSKEDKVEIAAIVVEAFKACMEENKEHVCLYHRHLTAEEDIGHHWGMLKDLGKGDISTGLEIERENHKWVAGMRKASTKLGMLLIGLVLLTITGGVLATFWNGFKGTLKLP